MRCLALLLFMVLQSDWSNAQSGTIIIGGQEWMAENLAVVNYWDGTPIPEAKTPAEWNAYNDNKTGCYCNYDNEGLYGKMYGKLYNWYAIKRGVAPRCWRVPGKKDFDKLIAHLGEPAAAKKLKATHSWNNDWNGSNSTRFGAFAGGCRNIKGTFSYVGRQGFWWTNDPRKLNNGKETGLFFTINYDDRCSYDVSEDFGFSVRCMRDVGTMPPPCP
jgi:uncharacterized protein (TIGR02145 family)